MYIAVGEVFSAHIIKMVAGLEFSPVVQKFFVFRLLDIRLHSVKLVQRIRLHRIA